MLIKARVVDEFWNPVFETQTEINPVALMVVAEQQETMAREKGADWIHGAITFYGQELVRLMSATRGKETIDKAVMELALVTWLFDSISCGLSAEIFAQSNLQFTVTSDGIVKYDRIPANSDSQAKCP